jgi:D-sedoheptulose 7-phosphate isomerase
MSNQFAINPEAIGIWTSIDLQNHGGYNCSKIDFASHYLSYLSELMKGLDLEVIESIINVIIDAGERSKSMYFIGNGGSAATASHCANDIAIGTRASGHNSLKAISLADNQAILTALANDYGYSNIFAKQLEGVIEAGDVLFAFSVSGNSPNILKALQYAKNYKATTIGCTGFDGGKMLELTDLNIHVPTHKGEYGPVEDIFSILGHLIYSYLKVGRQVGFNSD